MSAFTDNATLMPCPRSYVKVGLGGAGNYIPSHKLTSSPIPCAPRTSTTQTNDVFYTGIGGAGNRTSSQDRAFLSISEEKVRGELRRESAATSWHHGIGGAGNCASSDDESSASEEGSSEDSLKSGKTSGRLGGANRIKEKIVKKWEARNQRVSLFDAWQRKLPTIEREAVDARSVDGYDAFAVKC